MKILFGPGGVGSPAVNGLMHLHKLGLEAAEIEFTYGVNMKNEYAEEVGKVAAGLKISLSVHAPYYINLVSEDLLKRKASVKRILDSCERAHYLGAKFVVFHPAFYGKMNKNDVYDIVKEAIVFMMEIIKEKNWDVVLCPETTGKISAFGTLDELLKLSKETSCGVCVDFAHLRARYQGVVDYDKSCEILKKFDKEKITSHFSGIEWGNGGEKNHIPTIESQAKELISALVKHKISIRIINESPVNVEDSLMCKSIYERL